MELNTIQTEGPWNKVAEALNDNFSKIDVAIKSGTGGGGGGTSIEDGSITTPKIANNAVTLDKVSKSIQESLYKADGIKTTIQSFLKNYTPTAELKLTYVYRNKDDIQETLGISDWALAPSKPTYTASEVGALGKNETAVNATKLATARTIWGQSFDGTGDVKGDATVTGQLNVGSYIISMRSAGENTVQCGNNLVTADMRASIDSFVRFMIRKTSFKATIIESDGVQTALLAGNVGIGTNTPSEKLHVNGNTRIDGNLAVNGGTIGYDATNKIWNLLDSLNVGRALTVRNKLTVDMSGYGNSQFEMKTNAGKSTLLYVKDFDWRFCNDDWSVMHKILHSGNLNDYKLSDFTDDVVSGAVTAEVNDRMRNYMTRDELKLTYVYRNKGDIQETLGIADWALESENPSYTKAEMDTKLGLKQNTLVSSSTIKTINGESILGSGNIQINSDGTTSVVEVVLDVSKLTVGSNFTITQEQFDNIKASRFGRTVVIKESQYSDSEWGQVLSCYRVYVGSSVYAVRVSILHKDGGALSGSADNARLYNIDIMDYTSSSYSCQVTSINNLY